MSRNTGKTPWSIFMGKSGSDAVKNLELIELIALLAFNSLKIGLKE